MTKRSSSFFTLRSIALACGLALGAVAAAQAAPDARLLAAAEKAQPAVIDNLKEMVQIESGSLNVDGLLKMADVIEGRLKAAGFKTERRKTQAGAGADIVIGTLKGTGKRKIMLQGHMDTVYAAGILGSQPYKVDGNRIYGPGIADDKGGIAVMLASLKILADAGWRDYDTLTVLLNPDEEVGSVGSGELIATTADLHDTVLSFEPTAAKSVAKGESLLLGAAGIAQATMEVKGRAAHAGAAPELGRNALYELSYQMLQTKDLAKDIPGVTLNWTVARATGPINQITEKAQALGDIRITQPGAEKKLNEVLQAKIASGKLIPDTETTVKVEVGRPAFVAGAKGRALAEKAQAIYKEIDRDLALTPMTGGGTDAGYAGRSGKATVVESFGLAGFGYHARDEYIEVDSIVPRIYLVTRLLTEIGKQ
ncbi:M20/M25/M40 family metallo-hydrolase [Variovorax sp. RKNM96]|uniref:M20/M25/M40 family metallo-hydrolase n=1 Tax=Variovorax sp. RKNM96 TaxID=2681552 RepID=UPI00197E5F81|nr:M20/M25/M40 family metallo-hydrolase [Variovorax sp. RKNM96]QSI29659.1 M20/M25/M40 family metallo-hydrolase [Variovorax sp. RKNM96]